METFTKVVIFVLVNALGFTGIAVCYHIGIMAGAIDSASPGFDAKGFALWFFAGSVITWFICALFSTAYFFLKGTVKLFFLWAPVYIPLLYGFSVIFLPVGA